MPTVHYNIQVYMKPMAGDSCAAVVFLRVSKSSAANQRKH